MRVLIVDDEGVARKRLRKMLSEHSECEIVGEAGDGESAIAKIESLQPDVVFLDVQMPGCDGLEVAASLGEPIPAIIFCTAYDEYAVDAFELNALDYLLKPVTRLRLARTLERLQQEKLPAKGKSDSSLASPQPPARFLGKHGNRFHVVDRDRVLYFSSEGGLSQLHTSKRRLWMQPSLSELEERLQEANFFRISRSALVNLMHLKEVAPLAGGFGQVLLSNGTRLDVSRRKYKPLMEALGEG